MEGTEPKIKFKLGTDFQVTADERNDWIRHTIIRDGSMSAWVRRVLKEAYDKERKETDA